MARSADADTELSVEEIVDFAQKLRAIGVAKFSGFGFQMELAPPPESPFVARPSAQSLIDEARDLEGKPSSVETENLYSKLFGGKLPQHPGMEK